MRFASVLIAASLFACGSPAPAIDAGLDAASQREDGSTERDAGTEEDDAGPAPSCPGTPIEPAPFDCTSSEPPIPLGEPITAPDRTWTWVPFDDAFCMDGSSTGIGVSLNPDSDRVVIFLEGGGACFDTFSCGTVANPNGFDERDFAAIAGPLGRGLFARDDDDNPLRDASFVYVPYCSGDVHGGSNPEGPGGRMHVGYQNVTAYLERLIPTFTDDAGMNAAQVLLMGRSAGGLGALVNFDQVQRAFGCTPVHMLDDAGAVLSDEYLRPCLQARVRERWNLDAAIPSDCVECSCPGGGGLWNVYPYLARRHPERRFGLISAMEDATFRQFYGYGYSPRCDFPTNMPGADYAAGLTEVREAMASDANFHTFYVPGDQHTFTYGGLATTIGGTSLLTWIEQLVSGDTAWTDVGP